MWLIPGTPGEDITNTHTFHSIQRNYLYLCREKLIRMLLWLSMYVRTCILCSSEMSWPRPTTPQIPFQRTLTIHSTQGQQPVPMLSSLDPFLQLGINQLTKVCMYVCTEGLHLSDHICSPQNVSGKPGVG